MGSETFPEFADVLDEFVNLTKLTTTRSFVGWIGSDGLKELASLTASLKVLEIVHPAAGASRRDAYPFHMCVFLLVFRFGRTLEVLHLQIDGMVGGEADNELMGQIRTRCPLLCALRLPSISFHYEDILDMSKSHPNLRALECKVDFSRCDGPKPYNKVCIRIMERFPDLELLSVLGCCVQAESMPMEQYPKLKVFATDELCVNVTADNSSFTINSNTDPQMSCRILLDMSTSVKTLSCNGCIFETKLTMPCCWPLLPSMGQH